MQKVYTTHFAPPERATRETILRQRDALAADPILTRMLDCFPEPVAVLNHERQMVFANDKLARLLGRAVDSLLGLRVGEALMCIHADEEEYGCGTSRFCRLCGAAQAMVSSQRRSAPDVQDCRMTYKRTGAAAAMDLRVWASPIEFRGETFTVLAIRDITDEKRRELLERTFFHDVLNVAGGLRGILEVWPELTGDEAVAVGEQARTLAETVIEEIEAQRDLSAAERGDLTVRLEPFDVAPHLVRLCLLYSHHSTARSRVISPPTIVGPTVIRSDEVLLGRVLGSLIKNALEASAVGQAVSVSYINAGAPTFHVHNDTFMPEDVQLQIFQRSFSTRGGKGRGVGTYSVKLLIDRYLGGWVTFHSDRESGTTFTVTLPR